MGNLFVKIFSFILSFKPINYWIIDIKIVTPIDIFNIETNTVPDKILLCFLDERKNNPKYNDNNGLYIIIKLS